MARMTLDEYREAARAEAHDRWLRVHCVAKLLLCRVPELTEDRAEALAEELQAVVERAFVDSCSTPSVNRALDDETADRESDAYEWLRSRVATPVKRAGS